MTKLINWLTKLITGNRKPGIYRPGPAWRCAADIPPVPPKLARDVAAVAAYPDVVYGVTLKYDVLGDKRFVIELDVPVWRN
jgi:hypothetical protein